MISFRSPGVSRGRPLAAFLLTCLAGSAAAASAALAPAQGSLDLTVGALRIVQTLPNVTLIGGKPVFVRATLQFTGTLPGGTLVDGLLRVYVDGIEASYSPIFSENGPIVPPAAPSILNQNHTLNFVFIPPVSGDVMLVAEVNPAGPGQVSETNFANNTFTSAGLEFECARRPELVYVAIDYRPGGGGGSNPPPANLIEPGVGDNFLQGIYPTGDWDYRPSDVPTKLWTSSLSGTGSGLLSALLVDLQMTSPQPDFIYGWVPGGLSYNGQASGIPGQAGMGNTESIRHQRTLAHEMGHCFGRSHINNAIGVVGVDVEHHLNLTQGLPQLKPASLFDVMVAGLLTNQAWVYPVNYEAFENNPVFDCGAEVVAASSSPSLLVTGLWNRAQGSVTLTDTVAFRGGVASAPVPLGEADLLLRVWANGELTELGLRANTTTDCAVDAERSTDSDQDALPIASFLTVLPASLAPSSVERLAIVDPTSGLELARLARSDAAPRIALGELRPAGGELRLEWSASDTDGNALRHYVRYSPDGVRMVPLATGSTETGLTLDLARLPRLERGGFLELLTSDGLHTVELRSGDLSELPGLAALGGSPPSTHVLTPDSGKVFPKGATVLLHSSGWDLEDRSLDGTSIVWSSSVDGVVANGRVASVASLSVGGHVLTVTATDSDGMQDTDTTLVTITDRPLPDTGLVVCQDDVGFGGPGTALLEICGGDLSTGTMADVSLTGATPSSTVWLVSGGSSNPTAVLGGLLVPVPVDNIVAFFTDPAGNLTLPNAIQGGGGPASLFVQAVYPDPGSPSGFGFTNAVRADILP